MPEDWNINDHRWRESKYLDYVYRIDKSNITQLNLDSVERVRFAPDEPEQFADFAGRFADLGIRHLQLEGNRGAELRYAVATRGVRVPGTRYVLRVSRPWYAFFEEQLGDFPPLPSDWMVGARLVRCPDGGVEWLGRRHPMAAWEGFDLSGFRELPSGWRCERAWAPKMDEGLRHEIDRVLAEIAEYSEHILPEMATLNPGLFVRERRVTRLGLPRWDRPPLIDWQLAAARLASALCAEPGELPRIFNVAEFRDFMPDPIGFEYLVHDGRIRWLFQEWRRDWRRIDKVPERFQPQDPHDEGQCRAAVKNWLLDPRTRSDELWDVLFMGLNTVADAEPDVAHTVLDIRAWRERILSDNTLTEAERQDELSKTYYYFNHVVNNAVLHTLHTLADNNFMEIRKFLQLPSFRGGYAGFLPEYLLETLYAKVQVLTDLRLCSGRVIGPSTPDRWWAHDDR